MPDLVKPVFRTVDSRFSIPGLVNEIRARIDQGYEEARDFHPGGITVEVRIHARGEPRPRP